MAKWFNVCFQTKRLWVQISLQSFMGAVFMNYEKSKTSDPHRPLLNHSDKKNLKKYKRIINLTLSNLNIYYIWKNIK